MKLHIQTLYQFNSRMLGMKLLSTLLWFVIALSSTVSHAAPVTRFIHNDALGSPIAATDQNGDVVWKEEYQPFGERIINDSKADTQKRWFTGHVQDSDTGLVYMGARFYDPSIGRFLSPDPVGFSPNAPMMFNRYAYANNNPYKYVDPDGRAPHRWADGNYSDNDGQANPGWSAQINRAQGQIGYGLSEGWQYSPAIMVGAGEGVALFGLFKQGLKAFTKGAANKFPKNADNLLSELPRDAKGRIYPSSNVRIRPEQHALKTGETYAPRHHGQHYHVETRVDAAKSWNNKKNVTKIKPPGYQSGQGTGFLPGEKFPGAN